MVKDIISRYVWLVDTIKRHGRITREEVNQKWRLTPFYNGSDLSRRTFYNYRMAVEELFHISIECDPSTFEYYIPDEGAQMELLNNWLLNSATTNSLITNSRDIADRVFLEDVPSAREHLPLVIDALREKATIKFNYHPYTRSRPTPGVTVEPYFAKIFKQRWYVVGRNVKEGRVKTYALDRMSGVQLTGENFEIPADFDTSAYFSYAFGIIVDKGEPKTIKLRVEATQAKYFRALPLHRSQEEELVADQFSIFKFKMLITADLINELLSYGSRITVLLPPELKAAIVTELKKALDNYQ